MDERFKKDDPRLQEASDKFTPYLQELIEKDKKKDMFISDFFESNYYRELKEQAAVYTKYTTRKNIVRMFNIIINQLVQYRYSKVHFVNFTTLKKDYLKFQNSLKNLTMLVSNEDFFEQLISIESIKDELEPNRNANKSIISLQSLKEMLTTRLDIDVIGIDIDDFNSKFNDTRRELALGASSYPFEVANSKSLGQSIIKYLKHNHPKYKNIEYLKDSEVFRTMFKRFKDLNRK